MIYKKGLNNYIYYKYHYNRYYNHFLKFYLNHKIELLENTKFILKLINPILNKNYQNNKKALDLLLKVKKDYSKKKYKLNKKEYERIKDLIKHHNKFIGVKNIYSFYDTDIKPLYKNGVLNPIYEFKNNDSKILDVNLYESILKTNESFILKYASFKDFKQSIKDIKIQLKECHNMLNKPQYIDICNIYDINQYNVKILTDNIKRLIKSFNYYIYRNKYSIDFFNTPKVKNYQNILNKVSLKGLKIQSFITSNTDIMKKLNISNISEYNKDSIKSLIIECLNNA